MSFIYYLLKNPGSVNIFRASNTSGVVKLADAPSTLGEHCVKYECYKITLALFEHFAYGVVCHHSVVSGYDFVEIFLFSQESHISEKSF